jgi:hypothetical protein
MTLALAGVNDTTGLEALWLFSADAKTVGASETVLRPLTSEHITHVEPLVDAAEPAVKPADVAELAEKFDRSDSAFVFEADLLDSLK